LIYSLTKFYLGFTCWEKKKVWRGPSIIAKYSLLLLCVCCSTNY